MNENSEIAAIIEEINEEVKHDEVMKFLKNHQNIVLGIIIAIVIGIFAHSSWHSRRQKQLEQVTSALVNVVQSPHGQNDLMLSKLIDDAPTELKPLLSIIKYGQRLQTQSEIEKNAEELLALCNKNGIDPIWKDLATIIYVSYRVKGTAELIKMLEPLTADDRPFRFSALEMLGMLYMDENNYEKSVECFKKILDHAEAPKTLKSRITIMSDYVKNNINSNNLKNNTETEAK